MVDKDGKLKKVELFENEDKLELKKEDEFKTGLSKLGLKKKEERGFLALYKTFEIIKKHLKVGEKYEDVKKRIADELKKEIPWMARYAYFNRIHELFGSDKIHTFEIGHTKGRGSLDGVVAIGDVINLEGFSSVPGWRGFRKEAQIVITDEWAKSASSPAPPSPDGLEQKAQKTEGLYEKFDKDGRNGNGSVSISVMNETPAFRNSLVGRILADYKGGKVLFVGMGTGQLEKEAKEKGVEVFGIDFEQSLVKIAKEKGVPGIRADGNRLPFGNEKFTAVIFPESIDELDISRALEGAKRVLVPGGKIYIASNIGDSRRLQKQEYSQKEIEEELIKNGFGSIEIAQEKAKIERFGDVGMTFIQASKPTYQQTTEDNPQAEVNLVSTPENAEAKLMAQIAWVILKEKHEKIEDAQLSEIKAAVERVRAIVGGIVNNGISQDTEDMLVSLGYTLDISKLKKDLEIILKDKTLLAQACRMAADRTMEDLNGEVQDVLKGIFDNKIKLLILAIEVKKSLEKNAAQPPAAQPPVAPQPAPAQEPPQDSAPVIQPPAQQVEIKVVEPQELVEKHSLKQSLPEKIIVIGDIHAQADKLGKMLQEAGVMQYVNNKWVVADNVKNGKIQVILLGDLIHGEREYVGKEQQISLIRAIMDLQVQANGKDGNENIKQHGPIIVLGGNHEKAELERVAKERTMIAKGSVHQGIGEPGDYSLDNDIKRWLELLPESIQIGGIDFAHGGPLEGMDLHGRNKRIWDRKWVGMNREVAEAFAKRGVVFGIYGHTPQENGRVTLHAGGLAAIADINRNNIGYVEVVRKGSNWKVYERIVGTKPNPLKTVAIPKKNSSSAI